MRVTIIFALLLSLSNAVAATGDEDRYAEVDRYALAAPASAAHSVDALARYLTAPFTRDDEKARAIFRWITDNISYAFSLTNPTSIAISCSAAQRRDNTRPSV